MKVEVSPVEEEQSDQCRQVGRWRVTLFVKSHENADHQCSAERVINLEEEKHKNNKSAKI